MKNCENCGNFDRTNKKATEACGECESVEPTKWKPVKTNGDRFRAMSDEEQQKFVKRFWEIEDFADWLKQPEGD